MAQNLVSVLRSSDFLGSTLPRGRGSHVSQAKTACKQDFKQISLKFFSGGSRHASRRFRD